MKESKFKKAHRTEHQHQEYATWVGSHPPTIEEAEITEGMRNPEPGHADHPGAADE